MHWFMLSLQINKVGQVDQDPFSRVNPIKIEEGSACEHGENRAQLAQQKGKEPQGAYTCQRKKKEEATGVQMKEGTSKKKNKTEGQLS